jgi:superfamily II DNA/RNA helicase
VETVVRIPLSEQTDVEEARSRLPDSLQGKLPRAIALASALKLNAVIDLVESQFDGETGPVPRKVAVLTFLRRDCEDIAKELQKRLVKTDVTVYTAHGGTTPERRDVIRKQYMESLTECILVGTGDAWGEAVNLNDTDVAVLASLPATPGQLTQWRGRFHRKGQVKHCQIIYPVAVDTVDEHIANILLNKLPAVAGAVALGGEAAMTAVVEKAIGLNDEQTKAALMEKIMAGEE